MRLLFSQKSKIAILSFLKAKNEVNSLKELSNKLRIPNKTLSDWFYNPQRYLPEKIVPKEILKDLEILDKQKDNWGSIKGGKRTYKIILEKYGERELRKRQSHGGKKARREEVLNINIEDSLFLEFYGILLGDGWLSSLKWKNKKISLIGLSGHINLDKEFFLYCQNNIKKLFKRKAYFKRIKRYNGAELLFSHKQLQKFLNEELSFPIGKKINLRISDKIICFGFDKLKNVLRGIFDTDGSFYLDKTSSGSPYPCISIQMKAPVLINQIYNLLVNQGFRVVYREKKNMITLKGNIQLKKWIDEIGSSNPKHLNKINAFVAQSGIRARPS